MREELAVAVFTQNAELYERLANSAKDFADRVAQFAYHDRMDSLQNFARDGDLIVLLDTTQDREACLRWIKRILDIRPESISVCLQGAFDQASVLEATRAGARDFLPAEPTATEAEALIRRLAGTLAGTRLPSRVLAVSGVVGGCGVSTLVVNLAAEIAKSEGVRVGVLGLSAVGSGPELLLNLRPNVTLFDLWEHAGELDTALVDRAAAKHASGVSLISAQEWPPEHLPIPGSIVRRVILLMQEIFPYVLLDLPRESLATMQTGLEHSEALLLVAECSLAAADGAARILRTLDALGYPQGKVFWAVNSVSEPQPLTLRQLCRVMPSKPLATIPFDPATVNRAVANGVCWSDTDDRAAATKAVRRLAATISELLRRLGGGEPDYAPPSGQGLLAKIGFGT